MRLTELQVERLHTLANARGQLTPSSVVEEAKKKSSPLHDLFEWNVKKAAETHWLHRAREIIGAVEVIVTTTEATVRAPMYVRDPEAKGEGYRSVTALRGDPVNARESLIFTLTVAAGHLRRAYDLAQPLGFTAEVDALLAQITGMQRRLSTAA